VRQEGCEDERANERMRGRLLHKQGSFIHSLNQQQQEKEQQPTRNGRQKWRETM